MLSAIARGTICGSTLTRTFDQTLNLGMLKSMRNRTLMVVLPRTIKAYLKFTVLTSRLSVHGASRPDGLVRNGKGFIYAFWHNRQILLPVLREGENIHCLISSSRDGEYAARLAALFGKSSIRGSTTRGGFDAMKQIMRVLTEGGIVAITPDGPLGPAGQVQPGVVQVARALGTPIVPVAFDTSRKKVFPSWDRFILPLPFSRIAVMFGEPVRIGKSETLENASDRLGNAIDQATSEATRLVVERDPARDVT